MRGPAGHSSAQLLSMRGPAGYSSAQLLSWHY